MGKVIVDITMSLDGFVTGPNDGPDNGLGDGGRVLHEWVFEGRTEADNVLLFEEPSKTMGRVSWDGEPSTLPSKPGVTSRRSDQPGCLCSPIARRQH